MFIYFQLTVVKGNIENIEADALVHPTDGKFSLKSEVGQ